MAKEQKLILEAVSPGNTVRVDLSEKIRASQGEGMDTYNPAFSQRVFSHSLLKEGGTLALESLALKELQFPLRLSDGSFSGVQEEISLINQAITSPGCVVEWQDFEASQPTYFDLASGQFDIEYSFREGQQGHTKGLLRLFVQPLGRKAAPRRYATASGVGPLLMISPYASSGVLAINSSTQAGVKGFGGQQQGASSGVFYWGNPSLAGDASAKLQISYVGPLPAGATSAGVIPYVAVSVLPDQNYRPLIGAPYNGSTGDMVTKTAAGAVASTYGSAPLAGTTRATRALEFAPTNGLTPPAAWAGNHRLFAIARASRGANGASASLVVRPNSLVQSTTERLVPMGLEWALYDLGTFTLRASETPAQVVKINAEVSPAAGGASAALDVTALVMLPDSTTWFMPPPGANASAYGYPPAMEALNSYPIFSPYSNTILLDDVLTDQFVYWPAGTSQTFAPSPIGMVASSGRVTQFTRGIVPKPDPKTGLPIIAILGVAQQYTPSVQAAIGGGETATLPAASWTSQQTQATYAQVNILERTRYILP